jgi:hydrogenase-4 component E
MGHYNVHLIQQLSVVMVITSLLAAESRNLNYSRWAYTLQALLICALLALFAAGGNAALWWWAGTALITKAVITPLLLRHYIRRTGDQETKAIIGFAPSAVVVAVLLGVFSYIFHRQAALLAPTPLASAEPFRTNLAVSLTVFVLGLYTILSRRDAVKTVIGLCLLENAVHLSLVSLAPTTPETALFGIASEVVITVFLLLYVITGIRERFGSTDTFQLSELHW